MAPVVGLVEISSDEEDFAFDPLDEWTPDLFDGDDDAIGDDLDDLIIMNELSSPPVLQKAVNRDDLMIVSELPSRLVQQKTAKTDGSDEDDDDCMVLDGDPDKAVTVADKEGSVGEGSSDELQIVAEKGPVACRDFPHSRHLCSNLPFGTTSHVKYCNMCHCFVCDAPAPCTYWGNGASLSDHCHATDKEKKWKTLRQAFKCRSLPASGTEKHQNLVYSTVSPRQQAMQCQAAVSQSLLSAVSNVGNPSLVKRRPLLNELNPYQKRHPSVRVSLSLAAPVSTPRAGRGAANPHIAQNTRSRAIFKKIGGVSPGLTTRNANRLESATAQNNSLMDQVLTHVSQPVQVTPITNTFISTAQNNLPQRSISAPIASHAQQGQAATYYQPPSNGVNVRGPQLSRCTSLTSQRTQHLPEAAVDICESSWEEVLAFLDSDPELPPDFETSGPESRHVMTSAGSMCSTAIQGSGLQHESLAEAESLSTASGLHDLSYHKTGSTVQTVVPIHTTDNSHHLNYQSNVVPHEAHLNTFVSFPTDELSMGATPEPEIPRLESANILFEFDWV